MNKTGFTLIEVLIVVIIVAVLSSVAMPKYSRSVERSRATEAIGMVQQVDDAIYAYYTEHQTCPTKFSQLAVSMPVSGADTSSSVSTDNFTYTLRTSASSTNYNVPATSCAGVLAERINSSKYKYYIWRNYANKTRTFCHEKDSDTNSKTICEMLDMHTTGNP